MSDTDAKGLWVPDPSANGGQSLMWHINGKTVSDLELKMFCNRYFDVYDRPNDGVIRRRHTEAYISHEHKYSGQQEMNDAACMFCGFKPWSSLPQPADVTRE